MKNIKASPAPTASPWNTFDYGDKNYPWIIIEDEQGFHVAAVTREMAKDDPSAANARLIAAAPDLLECLDRAVKDLCFLQRCAKISRQETIDACESAIAKATTA